MDKKIYVYIPCICLNATSVEKLNLLFIFIYILDQLYDNSVQS